MAALAALDDAGELIPVPARISKRMLAAGAVLILSLLGGMYVVGRRTAPPPAAAKPPVSILIADFENRTGDRSFEDSVEQSSGSSALMASRVFGPTASMVPETTYLMPSRAEMASAIVSSSGLPGLSCAARLLAS